MVTCMCCTGLPSDIEQLPNFDVNISEQNLESLCIKTIRTLTQATTWTVFTNHSKKHYLSFSPRFGKFECNTTSDWLNHMV